MLPWVYEIWMLPEVCEIMDVARGVRDLEVAFLVRGLDRSVGTLREGSLDPVLLGVCESNLRGDVDISGGVVSLAFLSFAFLYALHCHAFLQVVLAGLCCAFEQERSGRRSAVL